jgi:hypothetical protein
MKASDWIAALGVLGTWAIAAMALWGDWFRSRFSILRPVLTIEPIGLSEIVPQNNGMKARYYHLRVRNVRGRLPAAHEAQVLITRVEKEDAAGQPIIEFGETVPLGWIRGEVFPLSRTIGPAADASLLWVREDGAFQFEPLVWPNHFPKLVQRAAKFWVTVQVQSIEAESAPLRLRIIWDGKWHSGAREIKEHLVVSPDPPLN